MKRSLHRRPLDDTSPDSPARKRSGAVRKVSALIAVPLMGVTSLFVVPAISATAATHKATTVAPASALVKQGLKFYRGKTITWQNKVGGAGNTGDLEVRALAPAMAAYLHANIVETYVGASAQASEDIVAHATPDGLLLDVASSTLSNALAIVLNNNILNFNPARVAYLGSSGPNNDVMMANPTSPYKTFADLKNSTTPISNIEIAGDSTLYIQSLIAAAFGFKFSYLTGYSSNSQELTGFTRGDAPIWATGLLTGGPLLAAGKAVPILTWGKVPAGTAYRQNLGTAPSIAQLIKQYPPKTKVQKDAAAVLQDFLALSTPSFWTQPGVPKARLAALRAAFAFAWSKQSVVQQLLNDGINTLWRPSDKTVAAFNQVLKVGPVVAPILNG